MQPPPHGPPHAAPPAAVNPSAISGGGQEGEASASVPTKKRKKSLGVTLWIHVLSIFILANYRQHCWPAFLVTVPKQVWTFVHAISGMMFAGSIITTTILEWIVVSKRTEPVASFWFHQVPKVEKAVVLPALTGSIVSGVVQAFQNYGSLKLAPIHIKSTLHLLTLFGLWWGITDRTTQGEAERQAKDIDENNVPKVFMRRRISNVVSCVFLVALYAIMALKPGYVAT